MIDRRQTGHTDRGQTHELDPPRHPQAHGRGQGRNLELGQMYVVSTPLRYSIFGTCGLLVDDLSQHRLGLNFRNSSPDAEKMIDDALFYGWNECEYSLT